MIFLGNLKHIDSTKSQVGFIHNSPFDPIDGLNMTQAQLETMGILVENIPDPNIPVGQIVSGIFVDITTNIVTYEYSVPPITPEQQIADLESTVADLTAQLNAKGLI